MYKQTHLKIFCYHKIYIVARYVLANRQPKRFKINDVHEYTIEENMPHFILVWCDKHGKMTFL